MEMIMDFPGGSRVDAHFENFTVRTDQPPAASAPSPFDYFLASIGTCAGFYVLEFCQKRNIPMEGMRVVEQIHRNEATGMVESIGIDIELPAEFPEKYRQAVIRAAEVCTVKQHMEKPPRFDIRTVKTERSGQA